MKFLQNFQLSCDKNKFFVLKLHLFGDRFYCVRILSTCDKKYHPNLIFNFIISNLKYWNTQFMLASFKASLHNFDVCLPSLSWCKIQSKSNLAAIQGKNRKQAYRDTKTVPYFVQIP